MESDLDRLFAHWDDLEERRRKKSRARWECATIVYRMAAPPLWWEDTDHITDGYAYFLTERECEAHILNLELRVGVEFGFPRPVVAVQRKQLGIYLYRDAETNAYYVTQRL